MISWNILNLALRQTAHYWMVLLKKLLCSWSMTLRHMRMWRVLLVFLTRWLGRINLLFKAILKIFLELLFKLFFFNFHIIINVCYVFDKLFLHIIFILHKFKLIILSYLFTDSSLPFYIALPYFSEYFRSLFALL